MFKQILNRLPKKPSKSTENRDGGSSASPSNASTSSRSGDVPSNRGGNLNATSLHNLNSTSNSGLNQGHKLPQALNSKVNGNLTVSSYEALPSFRDVPNSEKQNLFIKKLNLCCVVFDFTDPTKNLKEKDIKRQTLVELVDYVTSANGKFSETVMQEIVRMISVNLFRPLTSQARENKVLEGFDLEEEEPLMDPAWPHLQIVYEFLLRFVASPETDAKLAKRYIDHSCVLKLLDLFDSEDPREREYLKTVLHRIYGKFMVHRPFMKIPIDCNFIFSHLEISHRCLSINIYIYLYTKHTYAYRLYFCIFLFVYVIVYIQGGIEDPNRLQLYFQSPVLARDPSQAQRKKNLFEKHLSSIRRRLGFRINSTRFVFLFSALCTEYLTSSEGFLTEEQRETLKIATQNAEVLSTSPKSPPALMSSEHHIKAPAGGKASTAGIAVRHVRRSHSGKFVRVKKDGGGGKGTWGKLLDTGGESHIDRNDPNYDSGEEPYQLVGSTMSDPLDEYKKAVVSLVEEYFSTGDVDVAASDLRELGSNEYHPYFIKRVASMAMDRHDKEKEMASVLLSALYADVITSTQISQGFFMLLESADDLTVDILDAVDILALFIARAVTDDILPPAFVTRAKKALSESSKGFQVLQTAEKSYLSAPHHAELVERRWGGSTHITVEGVKKKITDLLREYVDSGDTSEACRCIRQLGVTFFHHEVVKRALVLAMEIRTAEPVILKLLKEAAEEGLISSSQMVKGFARLAESLDDLALDIPSAKTLFHSLVPQAVAESWLDASFLKSLGEYRDVHDEDDEKMKRYKEEAVTIIHEYFHSDDIPELIQSLEDLGAPEFNPIFLKKLMTLAMDRKNREREMASVLLSALHIEIFSTEDIVNGFVMLLESAEDTALDILDASDELALFLGRAVIDDVLAPLNLEEIGGRLPPNCSGSETVHVARSLLAARHAGERILRCWGGGSGWAVEDAKDEIVKLLEEYETGGVVSEACQCIRDLGMPFFNHEVVKKALVMAMEKKNDRILDLLQECFSEGLITTNQMTKGFARISDGLDDLALDIPNAEDKFKYYVEHARKKGWLLPSLR